jgi:hypothetical protein
MHKKIIILLLSLIILYLLFGHKHIENYKFKDTGKKNKQQCKDFHTRIYKDCISQSGGIDVQGNCYDRLLPNLIACQDIDY